MNRKQLTFAREYRGSSQAQLAYAIKELSKSDLLKFEKGIDLLSDKIQKEIIQFLEFPEEFFNRNIGNVIENSKYRKKSTIRKSNAMNFENYCRFMEYMVREMSEVVECINFILSPFNVEYGYSPEYIVNYIWRLLKLKENEPCRDIFFLLGDSCIIIYETDVIDKLDGISSFIYESYLIIVVNKKFSNDRKKLR